MRLFPSERNGDARPDPLLYLSVHDLAAAAAEFGPTVRQAPWGPEVEPREPAADRSNT